MNPTRTKKAVYKYYLELPELETGDIFKLDIEVFQALKLLNERGVLKWEEE